MNDLFLNYLPLFGFLSFILLMLRNKVWFFVLFFYLFMQQVKNVLANYYVNINAPLYMLEVEKYSVNDASLVMLVFFYITGFLAITSLYHYSYKQRIEIQAQTFLDLNISNLKVRLIRYLILFVFMLVIFLILHILAKNTPLLNEHINKNNYWAAYALVPQVKSVSAQLPILLFIIGYYFARQKIFKKEHYINTWLFLAPWFLSIIYYILMKQKFGGPLFVTFSFFMPLLILGIYYQKFNLRKAFFSLTIIVLMLLFFVYGYFYMKYADDAIDRIFARVFLLQSEVWEVTFHYFQSGQLPFERNPFWSQLMVILGINEGFSGMKYVMSHVMEYDYFSWFLEIKINLSSAYPSYLFYLTDTPYLMLPILIIFNAIIYVVFGFLGFKVFEKLLQNRIIVSALYLKLFWSFRDLLGQGYVESIVNFKNLLYIALIILLQSREFLVLKTRIKEKIISSG